MLELVLKVISPLLSAIASTLLGHVKPTPTRTVNALFLISNVMMIMYYITIQQYTLVSMQVVFIINTYCGTFNKLQYHVVRKNRRVKVRYYVGNTITLRNDYIESHATHDVLIPKGTQGTVVHVYDTMHTYRVQFNDTIKFIDASMV